MGDYSKAMMKVFLLTIIGLVPSDMVHCICTFLDFCYFICCDVHDNKSLEAIQDALDHFHCYYKIFIKEGFNLP